MKVIIPLTSSPLLPNISSHTKPSPAIIPPQSSWVGLGWKPLMMVALGAMAMMSMRNQKNENASTSHAVANVKTFSYSLKK